MGAQVPLSAPGFQGLRAGRLTLLRATLESVKTRNVTLALPDDLLRRVKVIAAQRDTSVSAMLTQALRLVAEEQEGYQEARRAMLRDLRRGYNLGTAGKIAWSRDSLHER